MAKVGQVYYQVIIPGQEEPASSGIDVFSDIVKAFGATRLTKLGVQAPPGTKMIINDGKEMIVGRTGIYELDDDIVITSLYFKPAYKFQYDLDGSQSLQKEATTQMKALETTRQNKLASLAAEYPVPPTDPNQEGYEDYWTRYQDIQNEYQKDFPIWNMQFYEGLNGVYTLPNEDDPDDPVNFEDLYNVIIDFMYE